MIIQLLTTPLGQVATVRERRGTPIVWESLPQATPELARADAIDWINGDDAATANNGSWSDMARCGHNSCQRECKFFSHCD